MKCSPILHGKNALRLSNVTSRNATTSHAMPQKARVSNNTPRCDPIYKGFVDGSMEYKVRVGCKQNSKPSVQSFNDKIMRKLKNVVQSFNEKDIKTPCN